MDRDRDRDILEYLGLLLLILYVIDEFDKIVFYTVKMHQMPIL